MLSTSYFLLVYMLATGECGFLSRVLPPSHKKLLEFNLEMTEMFTSANDSSYDRFIGDGNVRPVSLFNQSLPGPTLVVYVGSEVRITVRNRLKVPTAVHWHGLQMLNHFYYDGVANISQPQIEPEGEMTYELKITNPPGTYWYHSHYGSQRGNGLYGAFVVLDPTSTTTAVEDDFVLLITDWWKETAEEFEDFAENKRISRDATGQFMSDVKFHSFLANGRGWHNSSQLATEQIKQLPIEHLQANCGANPIRLRVINVGFVFSFQLQVAGHKLRFLATDGVDVDHKSELFDFAILQSAERYDFHLIPTEESKRFDSYRIRLSTLERFDDHMQLIEDAKRDFTDVILSCKGAQLQTAKLMDISDNCSEAAKCRVLNCPFEDFPLGHNRSCLNPTEFQSSETNWSDTPVDVTHFLNFGGIEAEEFHTVNNIKMEMPSYPPFLHSGPISEVTNECPKDCGYKRRCQCFQPIEITLGHRVQLVFYNKISTVGSSAQSGMGHPVHLHGYHFNVLKIGYPSHNGSGFVSKMSDEITCANLNCTNEQWSKAEWNQQIPGANLRSPVLKDTIFVPFGGYAVVRFVANNPGWFVLHCHILMHEAEGMMRPILVGSDAQLPRPPKGYPNVPHRSNGAGPHQLGTSALISLIILLQFVLYLGLLVC